MWSILRMVPGLTTAPAAGYSGAGFFCGGIRCSVACIETCQTTNTRRSIHPASQLLEQALTPTRLSLGQNLKSSDCILFDWLSYQVQFRKKKLWDGTFGDAFQWFFWGVCIPVAGLIGALNTGEVHPAVGMILAVVIGLAMITIRVRAGKWPEGGEGGGGGQ